MCIFNWKLELSTVFQTPSETSIKGLRARYSELITLFIIFKSIVDTNQNASLGKKGISLRYVEFIISLSILKETVDID